ncbi:MAG TPA: arylsulfatase [Methylomirabilota bacterium]|nr:arylsulfatase [Methylomirabilota bacterium]
MSQHGPVGREVLPIPDRAHPGLVTYQVSDPDTAFPPIEPLRPPAGAPNVLVILLDDVGFGASSAFGGPCRMPTAERLAAGGLRYTRFHTTALCSPTRAALLSGRNHHTVGMGGIPEIATSAPGYSSVRPNTCAPLAETLRLNGYSTAQFGKCHEVPLWETSPQGPFDRWPSPGNGMEHFYGFIGGETNQWYPVLYENTVPVQPDRTPEEGYHLMEDLTDRAIGWIQSQQALMGDKPFFVYFAPGATHAPHHVPKEWADRYTGEFDQGWDRLREETFARQKDLGVVPQDCELTRRHQEIPAWDAMPQELIPFLTRQMEVYAGFLSYADHHVGRLIEAIEQLGMLDDTLVYYIIGDNGASPEGTINGTFNEYVTTINLRPELETPEFLAAKLDELGGPGCYNAYAAGWGHALNTPYQWTKQVASHWGGTRNATIVHWPGGIQAKGELRHQFHHVIDVAPTVLAAAGLPEPTVVHGVAQEPLHGTSMVYSFDDARAPEQHQTQYFEMVGNRGIYHKGWSAVTLHRRPELAPAPPMEQGFDDDVWELYDGATDWTQAHDLAKELPDKLHELQRLFLIEAARYQVLPLDDRRAERFDPKVAGRPELITGTFQMLYPAMRRLSENAVLNLKNKSYSVTAEVVVPDGGAEGVIVAQGGALGGWSLYTKHGVLTYCYNLLSLQRFTIAGTAPLPAGTHQVRAEFSYDGGGLGKGGNLTLHLDGQPAGDGRVDSTEAYTYSFDETTDVGCETGTTVSDDYRAPDSRFNGRINWVRLEAGLDGHDHLIDPEHLTRIAMTRQ